MAPKPRKLKPNPYYPIPAGYVREIEALLAELRPSTVSWFKEKLEEVIARGKQQ